MSTFDGDDSTKRSVRDDKSASRTTAGAETTARMMGTHKLDDGKGDSEPGFGHAGPRDEKRDSNRDSKRADIDHLQYGDERRGKVTTRRQARVHGTRRAKTSVAATFGLVFGLAALFSALTAILAPAALLFGLIGIVVASAGMKMAQRPGVTGRGVAIGGLVTAVLGLLLGVAVLAGAAVLVNDEQRLDQLQNQIENLRADLPSTAELREELPS